MDVPLLVDSIDVEYSISTQILFNGEAPRTIMGKEWKAF